MWSFIRFIQGGRGVGCSTIEVVRTGRTRASRRYCACLARPHTALNERCSRMEKAAAGSGGIGGEGGGGGGGGRWCGEPACAAQLVSISAGVPLRHIIDRGPLQAQFGNVTVRLCNRLRGRPTGRSTFMTICSMAGCGNSLQPRDDVLNLIGFERCFVVQYIIVQYITGVRRRRYLPPTPRAMCVISGGARCACHLAECTLVHQLLLARPAVTVRR